MVVVVVTVAAVGFAFHFNGHFSRWTWVNRFYWRKVWWKWWWQLELWGANLQSNCHHQQTFKCWTHHPTSPWPSLVAGPGTDSILSAFWHSDVSMDQCYHISLRAFVGQPMWKVVATAALLPPWRLLSCQCSDQLLVTVPFLSLHRGHGTAYHLPSELFHPSPPFSNNWRHICLGSVLANFLLPSQLLLWLCKVPLHRSHDSIT